MKNALFALASVGTLAAAVPAQAALTDYAFAGALTDGTKFNGAFTLDSDRDGFYQFSNYYALLGGAQLDQISVLLADNKSFFAILFNNTSTSLYVSVYAKSRSDFKIVDLKLGALDSDHTATYRSGKAIYGSGTISLASTAAVPEPGTWALMILGFGAVGYSMRRKKAVVRFA